MHRDDRDFAAHIQTRSVQPPATLYKYATVDTARKVLSGGKLRFQSPLRYNDPFDSQWDALWPLYTPEGREQERSILEQALLDPESWPPDADPKHRRAMDRERARILSLPNEQRNTAVARFVREAAADTTVPEPIIKRQLDIRRRMRVQCLSESDRSVLMWSHYADQHRGVVLGFDTWVMESGLQRPLERVEYMAGPPRLIDPNVWWRTMVYGLPSLPQLEGGERVWALAKHADWQYEREWRFIWITPSGTPGEYEDYSFPNAALVEVVSGCRTGTGHSAELVALARAIQPQVRHYRLSPHPSLFELARSESEVS